MHMGFKFTFILIAFILMHACSNSPPFQSGESGGNKNPLINQSVEKRPFKLTYLHSKYHDDELKLHFLISHIDESPLSSSDYQFQWPNYVFDGDNVPYELIDIVVNEDTFDKEELGEHEILLTITLSPPPLNNNSFVTIPFYVIPSLFEKGYSFQVTDKEASQLTLGDLAISDFSIEGKNISFTLNDNHPDHQRRNLSYTFQKHDGDQSIYPLFIQLNSSNNGLGVQLEFANTIDPPSKFLIQRTTVQLPEWRFSLTIPVEER
ncbi:hypothetical protein LGQ02_14355 [Bacillus shivajii]|uniref:hypothetical protein n=1 Tax=Bacillus shivajii TaxID=1983719 RepID=UPI001CFA5EB0|nr:hypothetical protein [Bacillus shivajii]UCZ52026.1 hypothetical protein LGQ02_14355 [Bacillus shivajii]